MNKSFIPLACLAFLFFFSQCSFLTEDNVLFILPREGMWLHSNDAISLIPASRKGRSAEKDVTVIIEQKSAILYENHFSCQDPVILPIPEGAQSGIMRISCYPRGESEQIQSVDVFFQKQDYGELEILYYPPVPMAGSIVEAVCSFDSGSENPYVRWRLDGRILQEGFRSEGADRFCFYGPGEKGNYSLTAELFPDKPLNGTELSSLYGDCEIYFNDIPDRDGVLEPGEWEHLFYCDGTHIDRGLGLNGERESDALVYAGSRSLDPFCLQGDSGYEFGSESILRYDGKILQGKGLEGKSKLAVRIILNIPDDSAAETVKILETTDGTGDYGFDLFRVENSLMLSFHSETDRFFRSKYDFDQDLYNRPIWLSLDIEPHGKDLLIRWYVDGILEREDFFRSLVIPREFSAGGKTVWGSDGTGYQSFEGVLLEWGFSHIEFDDSPKGKG